MNEEQRTVLIGAGSYVTLIVMIWFAMSGAPAWLVLFTGIGNGILFTYVMGLIIPIIIIASYSVWSFLKPIWSFYRAVVFDEWECQQDIMNIISAYIYEQTKMSNMQKGIN